MKRKGFSLVELMVVVAIIAILTAIALPMYSTFRRRAYTQNAIGPCNDARKSLSAHFQEATTFDSLDFQAGTSGQLVATHPDVGLIPIGTSLPPARGLTWTIASDNPTNTADNVAWRAIFTFTFTLESCNGCTGQYCVLCDTASGSCIYEIDVDTGDSPSNPLNSMDKNRDSACSLTAVPDTMP